MSHDAEKLAYWTEHHRSWQRSGLSQRRYCQQAGISFFSFDHWRRRVRFLSGDAAQGGDEPEAGKLTLIPVRVAGGAGGAGEVRLRSPGGWEVALPATLDGTVLGQLLSGLP